MYGSMPVTFEERDVDHNRRGTTETYFNSKMYFYGRELCFILAILFTTYAALQNAPPKVSKSPAAVPFFPRASLVADFYQGQLLSAFQRVAENDVSFIMYYAPWDAESQATRSQFMAVAQYYYKEVYFAAINCWQPRSECRQYFSKVAHFPVLIAYTQHTKGVQYKGPKQTGHMMRFLQHILRPLTRLENQDDLNNLRAKHDMVIVGHFAFSGMMGAPGYYTFYSTSLKNLENDPHQDIAFAVTTDPVLAKNLGVDIVPAITMHLWNETLEYPRNAEFSVDALVKWLLEKSHQVTVWVSPPGVKSLTLSPYVEEGTVLVLFTPRNPLEKTNHYYNVLKEVSLEYHNCYNNSLSNTIIQQIRTSRTEIKNSSDTERECRYVRQYNKQISTCSPQISITLNSSWFNNSYSQAFCNTKRNGCSQRCDENFHFGPKLENQFTYECYPEEMNGNDIGDNEQSQRSSFTSDLLLTPDPLSASSLIESAKLERCILWRHARMLHPKIDPVVESHSTNESTVLGLLCQTNLSLSFLAMDSLQFHHFAEGLGVDPNVETAAVIFNAATESAYILDAEPSKKILTDFILNYTYGHLKRSLRSSGLQKDCQKDAAVCVPELTSHSFHQVMDPNKNVVVLYHSPYCAFCHSVGHIFLTTAHYFRNTPNIFFARIDGESNDLPWQFTMHHYPSVLFFPSHRKSESHLFPQHLPITVPNLVAFILANLDMGMDRLVGVLALCSGWDRKDSVIHDHDCVLRSRKESLVAIAVTLSEMRCVMRRTGMPDWKMKKQLLLRKLQHLRWLHLHLGTVDYVEADHVATLLALKYEQ